MRRGGRTIGKRAAEKLGISCYDAELIQKIIEESGYTADYIKEEGEYVFGGWLSEVFTDRTMGLTNQDKLWNIQSRVIENLAEQGPCVIVGRCADYVLRYKAKCLNVLIHASMEKRDERIVREYGERKESPKLRLKEEDKQRVAHHRFYTEMKWGHAQNYHVCLDSGELGISQSFSCFCTISIVSQH